GGRAVGGQVPGDPPRTAPGSPRDLTDAAVQPPFSSAPAFRRKGKQDCPPNGRGTRLASPAASGTGFGRRCHGFRTGASQGLARRQLAPKEFAPRELGNVGQGGS